MMIVFVVGVVLGLVLFCGALSLLPHPVRGLHEKGVSTDGLEVVDHFDRETFSLLGGSIGWVDWVG